ncbi:MAG: hypothetical protein WCC60_19950 [Ilumatobacteraceae bacterium]
MDRRAALAHLAAGAALGATVGSVITTSAFADGGSVPCRPVAPTGSVVWSIDLSAANRVRMLVTPGSFAAVTCPCPTPATSTVEYRYSFDAQSGGLVVRSTAGGVNLDAWRNPNDSTPVVRDAVNTNLPTTCSFTLRWTVRWTCTGRNGKPTWRCRSWIASVTYSAGVATLVSQSESTPGAVCNT